MTDNEAGSLAVARAAIAAEVRAELARHGRTQSQVGEVLNLPQSSVAQRLTGRPKSAHSGAEELVLIAADLGVPVPAVPGNPDRRGRCRMIREDLPTAVYRFFDADSRLLYVGITCNPKMRFRDHQRLSHWWPDQQSVTVDWKDTRGEALEEEAAAILAEDPLHNVIGATTPPARPALPRTPVHRRPEWVAEVAGQVRAEIARRSSKKPA
jgi:transcriptional regulator with XRE-family HTH domain